LFSTIHISRTNAKTPKTISTNIIIEVKAKTSAIIIQIQNGRNADNAPQLFNAHAAAQLAILSKCGKLLLGVHKSNRKMGLLKVCESNLGLYC
jgi:hypothetical protein